MLKRTFLNWQIFIIFILIILLGLSVWLGKKGFFISSPHLNAQLDFELSNENKKISGSTIDIEAVDKITLYELESALYEFQRTSIASYISKELSSVPLVPSQEDINAYILEHKVDASYLEDTYFRAALVKAAQDQLNTKRQEQLIAQLINEKKLKLNIKQPVAPKLILDTTKKFSLQTTEGAKIVIAGTLGSPYVKKIYQSIQEHIELKKISVQLFMYFLPEAIEPELLQPYLQTYCLEKLFPSQFKENINSILSGEVLTTAIVDSTKECVALQETQTSVLELAVPFDKLGKKQMVYLLINDNFIPFDQDKRWRDSL